MAAKLLLPGLGGKYTSESFAATATGADTIDMSRCASFAVVCAGTGGGSVQLQQSFDMTTWSNFGSAITITSTGPTTLFEETDGPFGVLRLSVTVTAGTIQPIVIAGFPVQTTN